MTSARRDNLAAFALPTDECVRLAARALPMDERVRLVALIMRG